LLFILSDILFRNALIYYVLADRVFGKKMKLVRRQRINRA